MEDARTRIVCTIGPASSSVTVLTRMMRAGMDVARLNFSHGTHAEHAVLLSHIRAAAKKSGKTIAILQDLQGPKIRVGALPKEGVPLHEGATVVFSAAVKSYKKDAPIPVGYAKLHDDVKPGDRLLLDDGYLEVEVLSVRGHNVHTLVKVGGTLTTHKGINLPDSTVSVSAFTPKDHEDLEFGVEQGVDWICLSFVTSPVVIHRVRKIVAAEAARAKVRPPLIMAKVERKAALQDIDAIIDAADGIMLGRGDLGVEIPLEEVPIIQKDVVERCRLSSKPIIVATQMLESMRDNPRATRAEVSDVANAVFDHADAVMLSAESATGRYPAATVQAMAAVIREAERSRFGAIHHELAEVNCLPSTFAHTISILSKKGLIHGVASTSAFKDRAGFLNMFRPPVPIYLAVPDTSTARQTILRSGVVPVVIDDHAGTFLPRFHTYLQKHMALRHGQSIAYVTMNPRGGAALTIVPV